MHFSSVNKEIKDVDFYRRMHGIAGRHALLQVDIG